MSAPQPARPGPLPARPGPPPVQRADRGILALAEPALRLPARPAPGAAPGAAPVQRLPAAPAPGAAPVQRLPAAPAPGAAPGAAPVQRLAATINDQAVDISKADLGSPAAIAQLFLRLGLTMPTQVPADSPLDTTQRQLNKLAAAININSPNWHILMDVLGRLVDKGAVDWTTWDLVTEAEKLPWQQWNSETGTVKTVREVPPSTMKIPTTLYHMTPYTSLPSIRNTGLDPHFVNSEGGLNKQAMQAGTTVYANRDANLSAVYLATKMGVAESMDNKGAGKVQLTVRVPDAFRYAHLRSSWATGAAASINVETVGTTILSFAPIPPQYLFLTDPQGQEKTLPEFPAAYDWSEVATKSQNGPLKSMAEVQREKEQTQARHEKWQKEAQEFRSQPAVSPATAAAPATAATAATSSKPPTSSAAILAGFKLPERVKLAMDNAQNDSDSDGDWP